MVPMRPAPMTQNSTFSIMAAPTTGRPMFESTGLVDFGFPAGEQTGALGLGAPALQVVVDQLDALQRQRLRRRSRVSIRRPLVGVRLLAQFLRLFAQRPIDEGLRRVEVASPGNDADAAGFEPG